MNENEFETLNDEVIDLGVQLAGKIGGDLEALLLAQEYARVYAKQAIARAAMQQYREGRHSLATQILEGQR